jgi:hypothetical protein
MPVTTLVELDHGIESVWAMIADFGRLDRWHPLLESCELDGEGKGSVRTVHFKDWWAKEQLTHLDDSEHALEYLVTDSSRTENIGAAGRMKLTDLGDRRTGLEWISGHDETHPHAIEVNAMLNAYYPVRVGHLADALDREARKSS